MSVGVRHCVAGSELVEERQEGVRRLVAVWGGARRCGSGECFFFQGHVGVKVNAGRRWAFVTEPEGDHGDVDTGVQQLHCRGMPQGVWRYFLALERNARGRRGGCVLFDQVFDGVG